jgi:hypothetical protein
MDNTVGPAQGSFGILVPATMLNHLCEQQGLKDVAFLKMNIEGAERYALLGMERVIQNIRQICVACHDFRSDAGESERVSHARFRRRDKHPPRRRAACRKERTLLWDQLQL